MKAPQVDAIARALIERARTRREIDWDGDRDGRAMTARVRRRFAEIFQRHVSAEAEADERDPVDSLPRRVPITDPRSPVSPLW